MTSISIPTTGAPERATAEAAARREFRVIRAALDHHDPDAALAAALDAHQGWLQRLLGCDAEALKPYLAYRREMVLRFDLMPEAYQLIDSTECVLQIIRRSEQHAA